MSEDNNNQDLVSNIQNSDNYTQENKAEVYTADNGMKLNIMDQEGADLITKGPNTVLQQPPHGEGNPKYKSMGGDRPSLPTAPGQSFNDKDYRNPDNRKNPDYGPAETTPKMTNSLGNIDTTSEELRAEDRHKMEMDNYNNRYNNRMTNTPKFGGTDALAGQDELKKETPKKEFFDLEFGSDEDIYGENAKLQEENTELKARLDKIETMLEELKIQNALDPNRPKSKDQLEVDQAYTTINKDLDQKALNEMDQIKAMLEPKTPTVTPEVTTVTPEVTTTTPETQKKQRDFKTAALIAGVVAGGAAGILGGTAVGIPVAAAAGVVSIGGRISNYFLGRSLNKLATQIENPTLDPTTKERLLKRETNLKKIQNIVQHVTKFATGAAIGAGIANFISHAAMGGHGLIWNRPEVPTGIPGGAEGSLGNINTEQIQPEVPAGEAPLPASTETYPGNSFIHDGRVDLPGSAWDGNAAGGPGQSTLAGGAENFANYAGGQSEMAASQLGQDFASNNITDQLLSNLTTYDKHRLLTEYWNAIRAGNTNPELIETLRSMNTDGAQKLLTAIGK